MAGATATARANGAKAQKDLVDEFHEEYEQAANEAEIVQEHTQTRGWQEIYATARFEERKEMNRICASLEDAAEILRHSGPGEDLEKQVQEAKKDIVAHRERRVNFERFLMAHIRRPIEKCERIIEQYRQKARRQQEEAPLHHSGLEAAMLKATKTVQVPRFDETTGVVEFHTPATD